MVNDEVNDRVNDMVNYIQETRTSHNLKLMGLNIRTFLLNNIVNCCLDCTVCTIVALLPKTSNCATRAALFNR
jgi:hypothetical protein